MAPLSFASIGECMIELSSREGGLWHMGFAGDTFNAAWYARAILLAEERVAYITALGEDPFSQRMTGFHRRGGGRDRPYPDRSQAGGRGSTRSRWKMPSAPSPIGATRRQRASSPTTRVGSEARSRASTCSTSRGSLWRSWRRAGVNSCCSPCRNGVTRGRASRSTRTFAPCCGRTATKRARRCRRRISPPTSCCRRSTTRCCSSAMPRLRRRPQRIAGYGVGEIVVKHGSKPCLVVGDGKSATVPAVAPEEVVDTTGAGDFFCGSYLAARHLGMTPTAAARLGHAVAAQVIGVPGALAKIDRDKVLRLAETNSGA